MSGDVDIDSLSDVECSCVNPLIWINSSQSGKVNIGSRIAVERDAGIWPIISDDYIADCIRSIVGECNSETSIFTWEV